MDSSADDDTALQAAIQASLVPQVVEAPAGQGLVDRQCGCRQVAFGHEASSTCQLLEVAMIDQWGGHFQQPIRDFQTASAICGYVSCAAAHIISSHLPNYECTREQLDQLTQVLNDHQIMIPLVVQAMSHIRHDRYASRNTAAIDASLPN
jgi:hypothetical protein